MIILILLQDQTGVLLFYGAEIIPIEPVQGNACEGNEVNK